jgi:hypothetical protein
MKEGMGADPAGAQGFIDGWRAHYDILLVVFRCLCMADQTGRVAAGCAVCLPVDSAVARRKLLKVFSGIDAGHGDDVRDEVSPANADAELVVGSQAGLALMVARYVAGTA